MAEVPKYYELFNAVINALKALGGSGTIEEINQKVIEQEKFPAEILDVRHGDKESSKSEVEYRLAWARTYLKKYGLLQNSVRGVWALSSDVPEIKEVDPAEVVRRVRWNISEVESSTDDGSNFENINGIEEPEEIQDWKQRLIKLLLTLDPSAFERLVQRVLRESGFIQVEVTGRSGDGGIDGRGIARVNGFLSFHVLFQCKRYQGSVSASQIRDFRGAMQGRADKGLLITTGTFTRDAIKEATRDGAPPIDLIDGEQLADKLKELRLGVKVEVVEKVDIEEEWFRRI